MRARRSCTAELLHHDHRRCGTCSRLIPAALVADLATLVSDEVLVHPLRGFGMPVEDPADRFELVRMGVVVERGDESKLLWLDARHRRMHLPHPGSSTLGSRPFFFYDFSMLAILIQELARPGGRFHDVRY